MPKHKEMQNSNMGSEGTYHFGAVEDLIYLPNETRATSSRIFNVSHHAGAFHIHGEKKKEIEYSI